MGQKDLALALKYFKMAADKGNVAAQINLGAPLTLTRTLTLPHP